MYAKNEELFKMLEKWYLDIYNLIQGAYLAVDQLRVYILDI